MHDDVGQPHLFPIIFRDDPTLQARVEQFWGGMLSREGRRYMEIAPRLAFWPGFCLTIVVYSLNMFGDAVRDLLDPRLRGGQGSYGAPGRR